MIIFGITGSSGSGKSTVSAMLEKMGVQIIDTDKIARRVVEKGTKCLDELSGYFGGDILNTDGTLDRKKLAQKAFCDDEKRAALNSITHKYIKEQAEKTIQNSSADIIAIDGAVIIGSVIEPMCSFIVSIMADKNIRRERIKKRDNLSDKQIDERFSAQPCDDFYKQNSKYIIYNNGDDLKKQVCMLYDEIKRL